MNTTNATFHEKRAYQYTLFLLAFTLVFSYAVLTFSLFDFFPIPYAALSMGLVSLFFLRFFNWLKRTTYVRYVNQSLVIRGFFRKPVLTPLKTVEMEPMVHFFRLSIIRVNFAIDGIQHSYFTFMKNSGFQRMKKRQAISRVL